VGGQNDANDPIRSGRHRLQNGGSPQFFCFRCQTAALTSPARLMVMRAAVSHSSIEIPAANTAIARCSAGFRSAHEILFIACPRDGFRLFFELLPYNYSHTVSDSLSVENDRLVTLHGLFRAIEPHKFF